jgi:hypothetical protein
MCHCDQLGDSPVLYQFGLSAQRSNKFSHLAPEQAAFSQGGGGGGGNLWTHAYHKLIGETLQEFHKLSKVPARYAVSYVELVSFSQISLPLFRD